MKLTESGKVTETKLKRIAALSAANFDMVFTHVIHHTWHDTPLLNTGFFPESRHLT